MNTELLDFAEKSGYENMRGHLAHAETLAKDAANMMTVVLAGTGGALAYAVKWFESEAKLPSTWGAAVVVIWLACIGIVLVFKCLRTKKTPMLYNEPMHLYKPELKLSIYEARQWELKNLQERIDQIKVRNLRDALWIDRLRIAAAMTPLPFIIAAAAAAYF